MVSDNLVQNIGLTTVFLGGLGWYILHRKTKNKVGFISPSKTIHNDDSFLGDHEIARQGFTSKRVPDNLDIIVIGAGVSGMTVAACMAREGKRVLVLEQHDVAGGNTHVFQEKGYEFDTGLHYVGGKLGNKTSSTRKIFDYITLEGGIQWEAMDDNFDVAKIHGTQDGFTFHKNIKQNIANLKRKFPQDVEAIDKYFKLVQESVASMPFMFLKDLLPPFLAWLLKPIIKWRTKLFRMTSLEILSTYTSNHDLIGTLTYCFGDYGETPKRGSFGMNALITAHYNGGAYYPVGGPSVIAPPIIRLIESVGGKVLVRAPVTSIIIDSKLGKATGVEVKGKSIFAPMIISSIGSINTYKKLIPENCSHAIKNELQAIKNVDIAPETSLMSLFVGIDKLPEDIKLPKNNVWLYPSWDHDGNWESYKKNMNEPFPVVFISFPSAKDKTYQERCPGKDVALVIAGASYDSFEEYSELRVRHRGDEYEKIKENLINRLLTTLYSEYPGIKDYVDFVELGTPLSNDFYLGTYRGAIYGLSHSPARFDCDCLTSVRTPIKGLYLSGQDVVCDGIQGALMSGLKTCAVISPSFRPKLIKLL